MIVAEGLEWRESARIRSYESDAQGKSTVATICNILQECASNHANHLGFGVDVLNERGAIWALSRIGVEISRRPAVGERVTINTWLLESRGPFAIREFSIQDEHENILVQSQYAWLAIDLMTKRSVRPETLLKDISINTQKKSLSIDLKKIRFPDKPTSLSPIHVRKSDLDIQAHVNNSRYIAWIEDAVDEYNVKESSIMQIQVNFLAESFAGNILQVIYGKKIGTEDEIVILKREVDDVEILRGLIRHDAAGSDNSSEK